MTQKEFQSKVEAICSCMEQESREQMIEQLYQEQAQPLQGNTDFNLALSTCSNSIHISYGGVTSKRELIEEMLRKYFSPQSSKEEIKLLSGQIIQLESLGTLVQAECAAAAKNAAKEITSTPNQEFGHNYCPEPEQIQAITTKHFSPLLKQLEQEVLFANDAAEKGKLARETAGGMELQIKELEQTIAAIRAGINNEFSQGTTDDIIDDFIGLLTHHKEVEQQLVETRKDTEMLNWMDKHRTAHIHSHFKYNASMACSAKTWREAITLAMEKGSQ